MEDGLIVLQRELSLKEVARLIEHTARWVAPETFRLLPIWYPEHARTHHYFKNNWSEPQFNITRSNGEKAHKREGNVYANKALCAALGITKHERPNWSCCHIWSKDDPTFQHTNTVIADHQYYSCVANMVLLPSPLKAFTDGLQPIKTMLRVCSANLYGWHCEADGLIDERNAVAAFCDWDNYPESWPRPGRFSLPKGTVPLTNKIKLSAQRRLTRIATDLKQAGPKYPNERVMTVLKAWGIKLPSA